MEKINIILGISNVACGLIVGGSAIPLIKEKVKMNHFYGVRFAKSFETEENWYKINKKGGKLLLSWSIVILMLGVSCFLLPKIERPLLWFYLSVPLFYLVAMLQAYLYARKL